MFKRADCLIWMGLAGMVLGAMAAQASASAYPGYILMEDNSVVYVHATNGVERWDVDGVSHLGLESDAAMQWFWYRVGGCGEQQVNEMNLTFDEPASGTTDRDGDGNDDQADLVYHDSLGRFDIEITLTLDGGPDGVQQSDLAEQVTVTNTTADETLDFHFFQYADFDLGGTAGDDEVLYIGKATGDVDEVMVSKQTDGTYTLVAADVSSVPLAGAEASTAGALRGKLDNACPDDLDGPATAAGDVEWAGQWDVELGAGEAFQLSKDKMITPEPATLALMGGGAAMAFLLRRRR